MNRIQQLSCNIARSEGRHRPWRPTSHWPPAVSAGESLPLRVLCSSERAAHRAHDAAKPSRNSATLSPIDSTA
jgi:hypothetical protein